MIILNNRQLIGLPPYEVKKHLTSIETSRLHLLTNKLQYAQSINDGTPMCPTCLQIPQNFYVPKQFKDQYTGLIQILNSRIEEIKKS